MKKPNPSRDLVAAQIRLLRLKVELERAHRRLLEQEIWRLSAIAGVEPFTLDELIERHSQQTARAILAQAIKKGM